MSEKRKNTDRKEAFQLAIVTTNRPVEEKKEWQLSCCQKLLWQLRMTISMFFHLDFYLELTAKETSPVRKMWRGLKEKEKRGRLVKQHFFSGIFGPWWPKTRCRRLHFHLQFKCAKPRHAAPERNYFQNRTCRRRQVSKQFVVMSRWPQPYRDTPPPLDMCVL